MLGPAIGASHVSINCNRHQTNRTRPDGLTDLQTTVEVAC